MKMNMTLAAGVTALASLVAFGDVQYGTVRRIDLIETTEQPTSGGTVLGGLIGGVIGNKLEQQQAAANSSRVYRVEVTFEGESTRSFDYRELNGLHVGDRVRLDRGVLERS